MGHDEHHRKDTLVCLGLSTAVQQLHALSPLFSLLSLPRHASSKPGRRKYPFQRKQYHVPREGLPFRFDETRPEASHFVSSGNDYLNNWSPTLERASSLNLMDQENIH
jgi:hypothetical protein